MKPNVIYLLSDQHRWDFIGYEKGNGVTHTPSLDTMASVGTVFRQAYCPAPLCSPSRAALASGRYGMNTGCFTNLHELPPDTPTFVSRFREEGYRTSAVGKVHMEIHRYDADYTSPSHNALMNALGWDDVCEVSANGMMRQGITCAYSNFLKEQGRYEDAIRFFQNWHYFMDTEMGGDPNFFCHEWPMDESLQETSYVGNQAVSWLDSRDRSQPFFLHVGFGGPHSPTEPLPHFMDLYRRADETAAWGNDTPQEWLGDGRRGYRAMISQIDHWVGRIREKVAEQGELESTIFVYTADHGEMAGDHGKFGKTSFFEASAHIPMLIAGPGIKEGQDSEALVENIDIGKTVCELCGFDSHTLDQGKSLKPLLSGETKVHRDTVYSEMGCDRMLQDGRHKLMWGDPGRDTRKLGRLHLDKPVNIPPSPPRLFDLQEDPHELEDLIDDPGHRTDLDRMKEKLMLRINENVQTQPNKSRGTYKPVRA
jgi:arylsulfatase A-like enzyme